MKKINLAGILAILFGIISLASCSSKEGEIDPVLDVSVNKDDFEAEGEEAEQGSMIYPSYNISPLPPDATGMSSNAAELAAKMKLGWNIGNTLEATGGENAWGNPNITKEYVEAVKKLGFNAIRLPCAWDQYSDQATAKIGQEWMNRVKEVVGYCVDNEMYVLLNIHWDGGWLEKNCTPEKKDSVNAKQKAYWEQIATTMRDFDEHLMFASANEPEVHDAEEMAVLHSYHQTFINTVRATGGKNSYRVLVVQGPGTNIERSAELMDMPTDEIEGRLMAEVHYYTPSQFCILSKDESWGNMAYYWGEGYHSEIEPERNATYGEEDEVDASMALAKTKFVDKGIPVILGEYGAYRRHESEHIPQDLETHHNAVDHWVEYVTRKALANGLIPFWWDTGVAVDRNNGSVKDQRTIDKLFEAIE
ncbi:glycoside hydrolase family 5 protein [Sinomicrobium weinanense]|uniref:Glycoside hydrolase family 5 protein n=1 Tax=Sinomicrobium weinanense TaxID=2842200 RepID=A0A926JST6_9FLAO|nr:glycoside hydrolase family 5 protein [Sinomicrobium weinanense]MBC9796623.1 glycoside hydrolase family 5 protein [Sinomicrobium weinanense]MBU3123853.1 glycoside hydrolase family 5 protein [Sinomicrobium weinanense]